MAWDAEASSDGRAVPVMAIEQLDDSLRLAEAEGTLDRFAPLERVDQPELPVRTERMRRPRREVVGDPAEAVGPEVVAEPQLQLQASSARRSSTVSRRLMSLASPSCTRTAAGLGVAL